MTEYKRWYESVLGPAKDFISQVAEFSNDYGGVEEHPKKKVSFIYPSEISR